MVMKVIIEHLRISIFDKPDIKSVAIFALDRQNVTPIYLSIPEEISIWNTFVNESQNLINLAKTPRMIESVLFNDKAVVLWPVKIEEEITVALFLVTSPDFIVTCIEEGKIFIPQIALGFKRIRLFEEVREKSRRDGLTSLYLRRYFIERLEGEIQRAKRYSASFSILMIDIDHFKNINDVYGHLVGDSTLKALSHILSDSLRPGDLIGRYGGEEFIVLLPLTTIEEAGKIAVRLGKIISKKDFLGNYRLFNMTVSIGISHYPNDGNSSQKLIEASDKALYWVKTHGRNGVKDFKAIQK
jgi:diguanylate cyclase (GGDEF)-like protein